MVERPQQNPQPQPETGLPPAGPNPLSSEQGIPIEIAPLSNEPELKPGYGYSQLPEPISPIDTPSSSEDNLEHKDAEPTCKHHWIIESPHGATSEGKCKNCGEEREFRNSAPDGLWESDGTPRRFPD